MTLIDVIILIFVVLFLGSIIYFRWIKKDKNNSSCHCYKAKTCLLKIEDLKSVIMAED